jgi:hypothetical protein
MVVYFRNVDAYRSKKIQLNIPKFAEREKRKLRTKTRKKTKLHLLVPFTGLRYRKAVG